MKEQQHPPGVSRRSVLKTGSMTMALAVSGTTVLGTGRASAHPKPENHRVHWGDDIDYIDGEVRSYATTNPEDKVSSLGVFLDGDALAVFDRDPLEAHLHLPDDVDAQPFTFIGFHYNPQGHPPADVYTVPHFDMHFYMIPEETVEQITTGPATYSIPDAQIPTDYQRVPLVDTDDDGEPDAPLIEEDMGEHLIDTTSPEFQEDGEFTHTMIYGAYDEDGDGTGRITFVEPMVTVDFLGGLDEEVVVDMKTPEEYAAAGDYPTQYVMKPSLRDGIYVSVDGFTEFPGASG